MQLNDLEVALREVTKKLTTCERVLRVATPVGPESGKLPSNHYVSATIINSPLLCQYKN